MLLRSNHQGPDLLELDPKILHKVPHRVQITVAQDYQVFLQVPVTIFHPSSGSVSRLRGA
jgi:hypothetical protein